jgi:hypothetical protein
MTKQRSHALRIVTAVAALSVLGVSSACTQQDAAPEQSTAAEQSTQDPPEDLYPDSRARIPWPTLETCCPLGTEEERAAFAELNPASNPPTIGSGGIRRYFPLSSQVYAQYVQMTQKESMLEERYHQLAAVVATRETHAKGIYREWFIHTEHARDAGVPEEVIEAIRLQKDTAGLPEKDAALIRFCREMSRGDVSAETFRETERLFGRANMLGIAFQVIRYQGVALLTAAYGVQLEEGQPAPW